ncbi:MAG: CRISPR-associated helicase Cas3' [Burkholderiales bacterium]
MDVPLYFRYWGKARPDVEAVAQCHLLPYHCLDVAAVGVVYLRHHPALLAWLRQELGGLDDEALIAWLAFWLALHDLGKFSLSFQAQRSDLVESLHGSPGHARAANVRHDSLGLHVWQEHVQPRALDEGWFGDGAEFGLPFWVRAVTGHHGQPPLNQVPFLADHFPDRERTAALAFVDAVRALLLPADAARLADRLGRDAFEHTSQQLSWWVAGLAVLADWVGSNAEIFRYRDVADASLDAYWLEAQALAQQALSHSGVLPVQGQTALPFQALFPAIHQPSPLQHWAATTPIASGPQLHLLEDVTGAGKTEAAVTLAHRLMASGNADGFFIGLPTMATANAMYGRIAEVVDLLFLGDASLVLAHGRKNLVEAFAASVIAPGVDEHDPHQQDESATRRCTRWLADHNKRALLAPAGVGTLDQALLGALQSKHQSLRLLGLFRKVLVVDEVHACDAYMQRTLELLLEFHARAGGSAILLSATLPSRMKTALLKAFARGCQHKAPALQASAYPLVTSWSASDATTLTETALDTRPDVRRSVRVRYETERAAVVQGIADALAAGQCVAWIRNTIGDALEAQAEMLNHLGADRITLFHARYALGDRLDIEETVLATFGRDSGPGQRAGRLLIATQVAEQSLDVDFDLVVSDLAPIDRLIQRAGRLRRHVRSATGERLTRPGAVDQRGEPCLWVLGPPWAEAPEPKWFKQTFPKAAAVYPDHGQLWLTARVLQEGGFAMPDDARRLIETVFDADADLPPGLQHNATQAQGKTFASSSLAQLNGVKLATGYVREGTEWLADTSAPSRLGEETIDVVLARWEGDRLHAWREDKGRHAWAYSTVRVAKRLIAAEAPTTPAREAELARQRELLPGGGKWVVFLAFDDMDGQFIAQAQMLAREGQPPVARTWVYDANSGLRMLTTNPREGSR